jgi:hypothetical protein
MPDLPPHDADICPDCDGVRLHRQHFVSRTVTYYTAPDGTQIWDETYEFASRPDPCDQQPPTT